MGVEVVISAWNGLKNLRTLPFKIYNKIYKKAKKEAPKGTSNFVGH